MKIWNSKSNNNTYFEFELKSGAFPKVFGQAIYHFNAQEIRSPTL